jgi:hypothetical protein
MTHYDYKVIPAPRKVKRVKGVSGAEELFAVTLTDTINEVARQGWEYVRAERLTAEAPRGWLRPAVAEEQSVLVFRRQREQLGPRLAVARGAEPAMALPTEPAPPSPLIAGASTPATERAAVNRLRSRFQRAEPSLSFEEAEEDAGPPAPPLGPAERG